MKQFFTFYAKAAVALWWLWSPACVMAQGQDANHQWVGNSISTVIGNSNEDMNTVYLYNVGTGKFLNVGSYWGTSVSAYNVGMPLKLTLENGKYLIQGSLATSDGQYMGFPSPPNSPSEGNKADWDRVYCDRVLSNANVKWTITETYSGSKTYTLYCFNGSGAAMGGNRYLVVLDGQSGSNRWDLDYPTSIINSGDHAHWKFVTRQDLKDAFKEQFASDEKPADATFLIADQDFSRSNTQVGAWVPAGFNGVPNSSYSFNQSADSSYYVGMGQKRSGNDDYQRQYGRYWIGSIRNLGNTSHANGTLTQSVTALRKGWYRVSCDGFYSAGQGSSITASLFANVDGTTAGQSNVAVALNVFGNDFTYTTAELTKVYEASDVPTESPYVQAAKLFETGIYGNSVMVYVPEAGNKLNIGIKVEGSTGEADWTAFDNFQLQYCGDRDLVLDEGQTSTDYMEQQKDAGLAYTLILKRTLKANQWNSLALPVNLTAGQFKTAFGNEAKLSKLHGQDPNMKHRILFLSVPLTNDDDIAMEAGKLYIMKPIQEATVTTGSYEKQLGEGGPIITVDAPYFVINNVTLAETPAEIVKENSSDSSTSDEKLQFCSSMIAQESNVVPAYSYVLGTDGQWHFTQSDMPIKGFRCWIATGDAAAAKRFTFAIDDVDYETITAINGVEAAGEQPEIGTVYNLHGQAVRRDASSLEGLPKGVYIYNNRKIIVR